MPLGNEGFEGDVVGIGIRVVSFIVVFVSEQCQLEFFIVISA